MTTRTRVDHFQTTQSRGFSWSPGFRCAVLVLIALSLVVPVSLVNPASGQEEEKEEIPPPKDSILTTRDGVELAITYYPPIKPSKDVVPVVLLHKFKGSRRDYVDLANMLQRAGHAVVIPDLRGHGRSTSVVGSTQTLDADRLNALQMKAMVVSDMEAVNEYLWERNNEGELNVNRLCIVGAEMGASVAMLYAARDWSIRPYGSLQLGQFVKGLVLISPEWSIKGLSVQPAMQNPNVRGDISILIAVGNRKPIAVREAKRIYDMLKPHHPEPPANRVADEKDLFYAGLDTALQGTDMLGQGLKLEQFIAQFINLRLVKASKARTFEWQERRRPHQ